MFGKPRDAGGAFGPTRRENAGTSGRKITQEARDWPRASLRSGSGTAESRLQSSLWSTNFFENSVEGAVDAPVGLVRAKLGQVGDVADIIALGVPST